MFWWFGDYEPLTVGWPPTTGYVKKKGKDMTEKEIKEIALKAVKEALEKEAGGKGYDWKPDRYGYYYSLECDGEIRNKINHNQRCTDDSYAIGNVFEAKEDAEKALEWLKAFKTLRDDAQGYKFDETADNYYVECDTDGDLSTDSDDGYISQLIYFKSDELARKSIEKHEKEWKIFYGVKED